MAGNGADGVVGAGTLHGGSVEDAAGLDVVPSTGIPAAFALVSSTASPIVAATSIGIFNLLVSSHTRAMSKDTNCGTVRAVS